MVIMPLITTTCTKLIDFLVNVLKKMSDVILFLIGKSMNRCVKKNDTIIEIEIFSSTAYSSIPTTIGKTLLWYFKKNNLKISKKYMYQPEEIGELIPIPFKFEKKFKEIIEKDEKQKNQNPQNYVEDENTSYEYLENEIYCCLIKRKSSINHLASSCIHLVLKSKNIQHINKYLQSIRNVYHGRILFLNAPLLNPTADSQISYSEYKYNKMQTFDNLFFNGKDQMIQQLDNLNNSEYFYKRGLKRKIALLICGPAGSGKTCLVNAIANYLKRLIICAPISRIQSNTCLEKILYSTTYNNSYLKNQDKIILFDEIDSFSNKNMKKDSKQNESVMRVEERMHTPDKNEMNKEINDPFDIGIFLSLLDGIHDQDDMIIIATANNISNIDPGVYRNGRLSLINLEYVGRNEIKQIIERYHSVSLTEEQELKIRNDKIIQNLTMKNVCLNSIANVEDIISEINKLKEEINNPK